MQKLKHTGLIRVQRPPFERLLEWWAHKVPVSLAPWQYHQVRALAMRQVKSWIHQESGVSLSAWVSCPTNWFSILSLMKARAHLKDWQLKTIEYLTDWWISEPPPNWWSLSMYREMMNSGIPPSTWLLCNPIVTTGNIRWACSRQSLLRCFIPTSWLIYVETLKCFRIKKTALYWLQCNLFLHERMHHRSKRCNSFDVIAVKHWLEWTRLVRLQTANKSSWWADHRMTPSK